MVETGGVYSVPIVSILQDPRGKGGTATAVSFYRDWMERNFPEESVELYLDERTRGSVRQLLRSHARNPSLPRILPKLQVPPYLAGRWMVSRRQLMPTEIHTVGASCVHGWIVKPESPSLVWLATTLEDERSPTVLRGRPISRRIAYRAARRPLARMEAEVLRSADRVLAMSVHTADVMIRGGVPPSKVEVVCVPVDTTLFRPPRHEAVRRGSLFVGRAYDFRKGFDRVRKAMYRSPMLRERGVSVVSPGQPMPDAAGVRWLGRVESLPAVYQEAELLLLPSRQEGLGIVALEAMSSGTPVVARSCGGVDRILRESGGGLVTESPEQFIKGAEQLLLDPSLRRAMGVSGRQWVERHASRQALLGERDLFRIR